MSSQSVPVRTANQMTVNTDLSQIFIGEIFTENDNYINNSGYDPITLPPGTVMGRVAASGVVVPLQSNASDGSQFPLGILMEELVLDAGESVMAPICVAGRVAKEKVTFFKPGDAMETVVSSRRLQDRIGSDTVGIKLVPTTEMTDYDNS